MNLINKIFPLYLVSGRFGKSYKEFLLDVRNCIKSGAKLIQLREKEITSKDFLFLSKSISRFKNSFPFSLVINDRVDIALFSGADGVHVGQEDIPPDFIKEKFNNLIVGVSTHSEKEFIKAIDFSVDYIAIGPIFNTTTKPEYKPVGLDLLKKVREKTNIPIVAIGGINFNNFLDVLNCGADSVAVCSDIFAGEKPYKVVEKYLSKLKSEGLI